MQEFENGKEVEALVCTDQDTCEEIWERMEYVGPSHGTYVCRRWNNPCVRAGSVFFADLIRPVRRSVEEIARSHYDTSHTKEMWVLRRLEIAIREALREYGVEVE